MLVDNDFASMPAVVAEGRRSINNLQRSAALFLTKTLFSMGLAAMCIFFPPYPFQPITMTLINFFCIGFPSFVLALEPNRARVEGRFLTNVLKRSCPASIAVLVACALCMAAAARLHLAAADLSTMCVVATGAVGFALIARISVPFTPLRIAVLAFVACGLVGGVLVMPEFLSIAPLGGVSALVATAVALVGTTAFLLLARRVDAHAPARTARATGFGRGVRMSGRAGSRRVTPSVSAPRRWMASIASALDARRDERALDRARAEAQRAVTGSRGGSYRRVVKEPGGIKVSMKKNRRRAKGSDS